MTKKFTLPFVCLLLLFTGIYSDSRAQVSCGTDYIHEQMMQSDAVYRTRYLQMEDQVQSLVESGAAERNGSRAVYNIPVVVHVIHLGEAVGTGTNIPDAQIQGAIDGLNDRFRNVIGAGLDIEINFALATRDPNGCATSGIVRVNGSAVPNYISTGIARGTDTCGGSPNEHAVKDLSKWSVLNYYNIWVVNKICGGWAGYAYYPWGGAYDGAVMKYNTMTYGGTTLTHEIGHGFNLMHTFNGDGGNSYCPPDTNCALNGDKICDTPPHKQNDCGSTNPCSGTGNWDNSRYNYMSYCFPSTANARFTPNQKTRITAALLVYPRANLLNSLGGTVGEFGATVSKTDISCNGSCTGSISLTTSCPATFSWSNGAATSALSNLCAGTYRVTITQSGNVLYTDSVTILQPSPVSVSASAITSSVCTGQSTQITASGASTYSWLPATGLSNSNVANPTATPNATTTYIVTGTNINGCSDTSLVQIVVNSLPDVTFTGLSAGPLCIQTALPETLTGNPPGGTFTGSGVSANIYSPSTAGEGWSVLAYSYTDLNGCSNSFADSVLVNNCVATDISENNESVFTVYPNPTHSLLNIKGAFAANQNFNIILTNTLGQKLLEREIKSESPAENQLDLKDLYGGIYFLTLETGKTKTVVRVNKLN